MSLYDMNDAQDQRDQLQRVAVSRVLRKNEAAQSSGKLEVRNHQPAASHGGHRRTAPWRSVPGSRSRGLILRPCRWGS